MFIISNNNQVLLQKQSSNKRFSTNKRALCAGHVDTGESLENDALRELSEKVGISISMNDLKPFVEREFTIRKYKFSYYLSL